MKALNIHISEGYDISLESTRDYIEISIDTYDSASSIVLDSKDKDRVLEIIKYLQAWADFK